MPKENYTFSLNSNLISRLMHFVDEIEIISPDHAIEIAIKYWLEPKEQHEADILQIEHEINEDLGPKC